MPINIKIADHLIMPFGFEEKWDISKIQLVAVAMDGTYIASDTKCVHIDHAKADPLRLAEIKNFFPDSTANFPYIDDPVESLRFVVKYIEDNCALGTSGERKFLNLYREWIETEVRKHAWRARNSVDKGQDADRVYSYAMEKCFAALMPFPQAHIYARDPFIAPYAREFIPEWMFRVDFAFWTGRRLVAIEIDGASHTGNPQHVKKDRMLARSGVHVIHILNDELDDYGKDVIARLMPSEVTDFISSAPRSISNPLDDIPF